MAAFFILSTTLQAQSFEEFYDSISQMFLPDPFAGTSAFRSLLIPMGGAAEGMGMATTAAIIDGSCLEFNPAVSSFLETTELSVLHNNWIADSKIEGLIYTVRLDDVGLGIAGKWLYLPFSEYDEAGDRVAKGYYSETTVALNASYALLSGFYFSGISLGANLKASWRLMPDYTDDEGNVIAGSGLSQSAFALSADLGLLSQFNFLKFYSSRDRNCSIGIALRNAGFPSMGDPLPTLAAAGVTYSPLRPIMLSFDFSLPLNLADLSMAFTPIWGCGAQVVVTDFLTMRTGFQLKGANPRISLGSSVSTGPAVIVMNYTLDLMTQFVPFNRLSVEVRFPMGDEGRAELAGKVEELYLRGLELYASGDLAGAISLWKEVVALDPGYDPAREGIVTAQKSLDLETRVEAIRRNE